MFLRLILAGALICVAACSPGAQSTPASNVAASGQRTTDTSGVALPAGTTYTMIPIATQNAIPTGIAQGSDSAIWFAELGGAKIGRVSRAGILTEYPVPAGGDPFHIINGPDGNLWFTVRAAAGGEIGKITTGGAFTLYPIPSPTGVQAKPTRIVVGPDGKLWFTDIGLNAICTSSLSGAMTCYPMPINSQPTDITVGPDHKLWFTLYQSVQAGRMNTDGTYVLFDVSGGHPPSDNPFPTGIRTASADTLVISIQELQNIVTIRTDGTIAGRFTEAGGEWLEAAPDGLISLGDTELEFFNPSKNAAGFADNLPGSPANYEVNDSVTDSSGDFWYTNSQENLIGAVYPPGHSRT